MKITLLFLLLFSFINYSIAQDFPGYRAGNYTGVNGVFFNPASIADSRYRFDFNLISVSSFVGNNQASFNLKNVIQSVDVDSLKNQFLNNNAGATNGLINVDVHGPSLMFNVGKGGFAFTTRARTMANIIDIDGALINQISEDSENDINYPYSIQSNNNMRIAVNSWTEFGVSYAREIKRQEAHFLKGGLTLKYLAGVGNGFVGIENINGTLVQGIDETVYLTNATGRIAAGFGGVRISNMEVQDLTRLNGNGFGGDLGFVYEWRPNGEAYILSSGKEMQDRNKYKLKAGLAILDIGKIKYKIDQQRSGSYDINIAGNESLNLDELGEIEIDEYKTFFQSHPNLFTPIQDNNETYKVSLPTTLQLNVDYHLHRGFYANIATQFSIIGKNTEVYNNLYYNSITLTPRYEGRAIGFYVPITYNQLTDLTAGISVRLGPLFFGSGSILTAALGNSKQADVHVGIRFGGLKKNLKKKEDKKIKEEGK